jgi:peptidoglycan/LPS O-acetylase OafA/YrhL
MGVLRMLLALCVLSHHGGVTAQELLPGNVAVRLFFIISGFYMALILDGKYAAARPWTFYSNRLLRLAPSYLAAAGAALALLLVLDLHPFTTRARFLAALDHPGGLAAVGLPNALIFGLEALFLLGVTPQGGLFWAAGDAGAVKAFTLALVPQAWSVSVELWFYLLAPFLVRWPSRRLAALGLASGALCAGLWAWGPAGAALAYRLLPAQLYLFLAGMLAYRLCTPLAARPWAVPAGRVCLWALPAALLLLGRVGGAWTFALAAPLCWACLGPLFLATRRSRPDRIVGQFSYPFYVVQFLALVLYEEYLGEAPGLVLLGMVGLGAALLWWLVERPVDRWRQRRAAAAPRGAAARPAPAGGEPLGPVVPEA